MQRTLRKPQRDCIRFFIKNVTVETGGYERKLQSIIGELVITSKQAAKLNIKSHTQISPYLEACCLRTSASVPYERTTEEVEYLTGIKISKSAQLCSIGSGSIESTIKQIDRRTKISGAQWKAENVPQVLAHRCAYLNKLICIH